MNYFLLLSNFLLYQTKVFSTQQRKMRNLNTNEIWGWKIIDNKNTSTFSKILGLIWFKIVTFIRILIGLFLFSNTTAIYLKIILIGIPVLILFISKFL